MAENFFPVVVDDFFDDPEKIVEYAKSLEKESDPDGNWPGKRTKQFWEIDQTLHHQVMSKLLSCYYDLEYREISWDNSSITFQEIPRFSENKNDVRNKGWIHFDTNRFDDGNRFRLAGLVYLTPNIDPDSGTSMFNLKTTVIESGIVWEEYNQTPKISLYRDGHFDREEYTKSYIEQEELFLEKTRFQNIFNRLIMYDTEEWHRANNYYNGDGEDARLTMCIFIGGLNVYPLKRIKDRTYPEHIIKKQLAKINEN